MFNSWLNASSVEPPDTVIEVAGSKFLVHSYLLERYSDFFKSASKASKPGLKPGIHLSNIAPEHFNSLLTYFYTGHLDLNDKNVVEILVASHFLRVPSILQICNNFLLNNTMLSSFNNFSVPIIPFSAACKSQVGRNNIIRPIANKAFPVATNFNAPLTSGVFLPSTDTNFRPLKINEKNKTETIASDIDDHQIISNERDDPEEKSNKSDKLDKRVITEENIEPKIIIDIANCDGPVRFKKVLNAAYNPNMQHEGKLKNDQKTVQNEPHNEQLPQEKTNVHSSKSSLLNCVYCKQTFKSKYCFQKHSKRHLIPFKFFQSSTFKAMMHKNNKASSKPLVISKLKTREVKPLDMNVQYYPCKTCGIKFPSYYFVHKHRKLCHSDEEN